MLLQKRKALEYEREFLASNSIDLNMSFKSFVEFYLNDLRPRIKYNTKLKKMHIIKTKHNSLVILHNY